MVPSCHLIDWIRSLDRYLFVFPSRFTVDQTLELVLSCIGFVVELVVCALLLLAFGYYLGWGCSTRSDILSQRPKLFDFLLGKKYPTGIVWAFYSDIDVTSPQCRSRVPRGT